MVQAKKRYPLILNPPSTDSGVITHLTLKAETCPFNMAHLHYFQTVETEKSEPMQCKESGEEK